MINCCLQWQNEKRKWLEGDETDIVFRIQVFERNNGCYSMMRIGKENIRDFQTWDAKVNAQLIVVNWANVSFHCPIDYVIRKGNYMWRGTKVPPPSPTTFLGNLLGFKNPEEFQSYYRFFLYTKLTPLTLLISCGLSYVIYLLVA